MGAGVGVYLCAQGSYGMCVCEWVQVWMCVCVVRVGVYGYGC